MLTKIRKASVRYAFVFVLISACISIFVEKAGAQDCRVSLVSGGSPMTQGTRANTYPTMQSMPGTQLTVDLNLGELSPMNSTGKVVGIVPIKIEADCAFRLSAWRTGKGGIGGPRPRDIGFGIRDIRSSEIAKKNAGGMQSASAIGRFGDDPRNVKVVEGMYVYPSTLEDISHGMPTPLIEDRASGPRGLRRGRGAILANLVFVVVPQYFDPSDGVNFVLQLEVTPLGN